MGALAPRAGSGKGPSSRPVVGAAIRRGRVSISSRWRRRTEVSEDMPSLMRFLIALVVLAGLGAAAMYALATFVEPRPREMTIRVPQERLDPR